MPCGQAEYATMNDLAIFQQQNIWQVSNVACGKCVRVQVETSSRGEQGKSDYVRFVCREHGSAVEVRVPVAPKQVRTEQFHSDLRQLGDARKVRIVCGYLIDDDDDLSRRS
jgi:hypothetical protein